MAKSKQSIIRHAQEFVAMASQDVQRKLLEVIENNDLEASEIAEALDIDEEEVESILDGDGVVTLDAFAKILIATNHCVVVKELPREAMEEDDDEEEFDEDDEEDVDEEALTEEAFVAAHGGDKGKLPAAPNFDAMSRDELVRIIQAKLWDSEIDIEAVSRQELIRFLKDKDKRLRDFLSKKTKVTKEKDKSVAEFRKLLEQKVAENPRLKDALKEMLGL